MTEIKHIPFGFPQNITVINSIEDLDNIKKNDYTNKNVHLKLSLSKLQKKSFNKDSLEEDIKKSTNANAVKITFVYDVDTNLRSREVSEQDDIVDKFKAYASLNNINYSNSVITKLIDIRDSMFTDSFIPHETFTLEYMSVRGAIGIMDGQHKEEMSFDFANNFDKGIIGITGISGSGKSTLLENMHPYPCMLSRVGSLKDHFCLKDSHRILIYKASSGIRYRITMRIDGVAKSIGTLYLVEVQKPGQSWEPITSIDGSHDSYVEWVNSTFGNKDLFLRTAFYTNAAIKNFPDLSQATKGDKMALFSTLAGTDFLSSVVEQAKLKHSDIEKLIEYQKSQLKDFDNMEESLEENQRIINENTEALKQYKNNLDEDKLELEKYNQLQLDFVKCEATYDIYRNELSEAKVELDDCEKRIVQSNLRINSIADQLKDIDLYKEQVAWYDENNLKRKELSSKENELRFNFNTVQAELDEKQELYMQHNQSLTYKKSALEHLPKELESLKKALPNLDGSCPVCGAPLSSHKKEELEKEYAEIEAKIADITKFIKEKEAGVKEEEQWLKENSLQNLKTALNNLSTEITDISNQIIDIDTYMEQIDIDNARDVVNNYKRMFDEESANCSKLLKEKEDLDKKVQNLEEQLNKIPTDYSDKIARLSRGIDDSNQQIIDLTAEIKSAEKELERIAGFEDKIKEIKAQVKIYEQDLKDYDMLKLAFGNNGIQALELDSAAPEISDIANSILLETYGDRFQISFDTQRDTKDGRKIDDFVINVFDAENGRLKRLDLISSGEGTLIKQTLYYAFSVIRSRKTGFCFKTRFLDESDSALDSELRIKYLKMIEAAHNQCGAIQTLLITHSQELKDIIEQKIEL